MTNPDHEPINSITEFIDWINKLQVIDGKYAFRGQKNEHWLLDCGALRRIQLSRRNVSLDDPDFLDRFIDYHRNGLLKPARNYDFATANSRHLGDLELLAKLQHVGAATCLLDFTKDALVALWMACELDGDSSNSVDGRVFAVRYSNRVHFREITLEETRKFDNVGDILRHLPTGTRSSMSWYWEPALVQDVVPRLLRQHSLFVFGHARLPAESAASIIVSGKAKGEILHQLERQYDLLAESLFPDLHGFARHNGHDSNLSPIKSSGNYVSDGIRAYNVENFEASIQDLDQAIYIRPQTALSYFVRAHAKVALAKARNDSRDYFEDAIRDYDVALQNLILGGSFKDVNLQTAILRNKANTLAALGDLERSCQIYTECLFAAQGDIIDVSPVYYNRANGYFRKEEWLDAQNDYEAAIERNQEFRDAYFNLGNTQVRIGNYDGAVKSFSKVLELDGDYTKALLNRAASFALLGQFDDAKEDYVAAGATGARLLLVQEASAGRSVVGFLPFDGNAGNIGNIGFSTKPALRGGKGGRGDSWFAVEFYSGASSGEGG